MNTEPYFHRLALRARDGDRDALAALVEHSRARIFALAYADLRHYEDARDAVANTILRVCQHIGTLRHPERFDAWMNSIARNEARRLFRRQTATVSYDNMDDLAATPTDVTTFLLRMDIDHALDQFPGEQAAALRLFYLEDQPINEIMAALGRPQGTIKSWLHRGRQRLSNTMKEYEMPEPSPTAFVMHTDSDGGTVHKITCSLDEAGYRSVLPAPGDISRLTAELKDGQFDLLEEILTSHEVIILDEGIGGRSALEILMSAAALHIGNIGLPRTRICVLWSDPWVSTAFAMWSQGVDILLNKNDPSDWLRLSRWLKRLGAVQSGKRFSEKAKRVVVAAQGIASHLGKRGKGPNLAEHVVLEPDHLALVLLKDPDMAAYQALVSLGVDIEAIRRELIGQLGAPSEQPADPSMVWIQGGKWMWNYVFAEAWRSRSPRLTTSHILINLLLAGDNTTSRALTEQGITAAALRSASAPFTAEEATNHEPRFDAGEEAASARQQQIWVAAGEYLRL